MKISIHWVLYPLLVLVAIGAIWYLHNASVKDAAAAQVVKADVKSQATTDKQVDKQDDTAQKTLAAQTAVLNQQLQAAKTLTQQITLLNSLQGTHITQAQNPSLTDTIPKVELPATEVPELAQQAVACKEAENQTAVDKIQLAGAAEKIAARDQTITGLNAQVTELKGGSKLKRILKTTEHIAIGVGVGAVVVEVIKK